MKVMRITLMTAIAACISTSAMAGGFSYGSHGGSFGNWSYADAVSSGGAETSGYHSGATATQGYAGTLTTQSESHCYICGTTTTTSSMAEGGNQSSFVGYGHGHAQSHTAAYAGSGTGFGSGFKGGYFAPAAH